MLRGIILISVLVAARGQSHSNGYSSTRDSNAYDYGNSIVNGRYTTDGSSLGSGAYYSFGAGGGVGGGGGGGTNTGTAQRYSFEDNYDVGATTYNQFSTNSPSDSYVSHSGNLADSTYASNSHATPNYVGFSATDSNAKATNSYEAYSAAKQATAGNSGLQYTTSGEYAGSVEGNHAGESSFADYSANTNTAASNSNLGYSGTDTGHSSSYSPVAGQASSFSPSSYVTSQLLDDYSFGKYRGKYTPETSSKYASNSYSGIPEMHYVRGHRGSPYPSRGTSPSYSQEPGVGPSFGKIRGIGTGTYGLDKPNKYPGHEYSPSFAGSNYLSREHGPDHSLSGSYIKGGGKTIFLKGSRPNSHASGYYTLYPGGGSSSSIRTLMPGGNYKGKGTILYRPAGGYSSGGPSFSGSYVQNSYPVGADTHAVRYDSASAPTNSRLESIFA